MSKESFTPTNEASNNSQDNPINWNILKEDEKKGNPQETPPTTWDDLGKSSDLNSPDSFGFMPDETEFKTDYITYETDNLEVDQPEPSKDRKAIQVDITIPEYPETPDFNPIINTHEKFTAGYDIPETITPTPEAE